MSNVDDLVRQKALLRISKLLNIPVESLSEEMKFNDIFEPKLSSIFNMFKSNEFDELLDDIRDSSNSKMLKKIENGDLEIESVGGYLEHMVNCYSLNPKMVINVLGNIAGEKGSE